MVTIGYYQDMWGKTSSTGAALNLILDRWSLAVCNKKSDCCWEGHSHALTIYNSDFFLIHLFFNEQFALSLHVLRIIIIVVNIILQTFNPLKLWQHTSLANSKQWENTSSGQLY